MSIQTQLTEVLGISHPVMLAGMGGVSGPALVAAVSNAGGMGVIGGVLYSVDTLRETLAEVKASLRDPSLPFGVDILIPQVGGSARKTNVDYTKGQLDKLVDVIIESGAKLFVSAVGVPPRRIVEKLHDAGVLYMNMVGHPKHVHKACQIGADIICAQGGEAGGHTGDIPTSVLIPACADVCKQYKSPLTKKPVILVAAGGLADGRGLAAALMLGASGAWIGTRFVTAKESGASEFAKQAIIKADFGSTIRSTFWSGRPLRAIKSPYLQDWEKNRRAELQALEAQGITAYDHEMDKLAKEGRLTDEIAEQAAYHPAGLIAALVNKPDQPAKEIVDEIVAEATQLLRGADSYVAHKSKL